jgi:hypothetical protein
MYSLRKAHRTLRAPKFAVKAHRRASDRTAFDSGMAKSMETWRLEEVELAFQYARHAARKISE